jgi:hypothetical protein
MEQKRSSRLILKTSDLTIDSTTNKGTCDTYRTTFTWANVNLRALLGDLYDEYDYFNLYLNTIATSQANAAVNAGTDNDRLIYIKMSGLPFVNQSFQLSAGSNGVHTYIDVYQIPMTAVTWFQLYCDPSNVQTFSKYQDLCNITISLTRVVDDVKPNLTAAFPHFAFVFTIIGVNRSSNPDKIDHLMKSLR